VKPDRIIHLGPYRRRDGYAGGVDKFAWYLERAIGCDLVVDHELAGLLPTLPPKTLFITDGGHGLEIPDESPILSVCHGSWVGFGARSDWSPEMEGHTGVSYEETQVKMWGKYDCAGKPNTLPVACSGGAKRELIQYHNRPESPVILYGLDHDVYVPRKTSNSRPTIIHVANSWRKGRHAIIELQSRLPQFNFEFLNAKIGEEPEKFARGDMFVHISCAEGNAFSCLEAMSCNLPMVVTNVGLFENDVTGDTVGKVLPYYSPVREMAEAIDEVWETRKKFNPREWIIQNATFRHFQQNWTDLIENAESFGLVIL
jgi:hypothetical protein